MILSAVSFIRFFKRVDSFCVIGSSCTPDVVYTEVFGALKKKKQEVLAGALLDFIQLGMRVPPDNVVTGGAFLYLTNEERGPAAVRTLAPAYWQH